MSASAVVSGTVRELVDDFGDVALAHFASALSATDRRRLEKLRRRG